MALRSIGRILPSIRETSRSGLLQTPERHGVVPGNIEGFLDGINDDIVVGWAFDPASPSKRVAVDVSSGLQTVRTIADLERSDLLAAGKGDGRHGFKVRLDGSAGAHDVIHARVASTGQDLIGSPLGTELEALIAHAPGTHLLDHMKAESQRARLALAERQGRGGAPTASAYPTRAQTAELFATANPETDPENIVSRFLEFERLRLNVDLPTDGDLNGRLQSLNWFLTGHGPSRDYDLPLSRAQIAYLNTPIPLLGLRREVSVAAYNFILDKFDRDVDLSNDDVLREAMFWWVERSLDFASLGDLITPAMVRLLTTTNADEAGRRFPLNYFARRLRVLDRSLNYLNLDDMVHRAVLIFILVVRTVSQPHLTRFIPRIALNALLTARESDSVVTFDQMTALSLDLGTDREGLADATAFRFALESHLEHNGFSLSSPTRNNRSRLGSARCLLEDPKIGSGLAPGIAVIGPTRAASGLGQATRLSIDVLAHAGLQPSVLDFGFGNPAPTGYSARVRVPTLTTPRQINLLHLNAEFVPLAFAYIDRRTYDRSYNIGYVFWELDRIPKAQALGLDMLDEIWVSSEYNREIYERSTTVPVRNVGMAVQALPDIVPARRARFGISNDGYVFLATFDSFSFIERKNPLAVVNAFQQAFPIGSHEQVHLLLKTQNRARVDDPHQIRIWREIDRSAQADDRIQIIDETLSYRELLSLKQMCDCYVSLHRSEGWGFGLIEAMQLGLPVIATGYSGNLEFCTPTTSCLVGYELINPVRSEYLYVERGSRWADPSIADAARHMKALATAPKSGIALGAAARANVERHFSVASIAGRYKVRLDEIGATILERTRS